MTRSIANSLLGVTLKGGWIVIEKINIDDTTGGYFSVPYLVQKGDEVAFLKALDYDAFFKFARKSGNTRAADIIDKFNRTYTFERDISLKCSNKGFNNVIRLLAEGEYFDETKVNPIHVPYLIYEKASGDVRSVLKFSENIHTAWKLKSMHGIIKGIKQLHSINISHQDLKPSNVLIVAEDISKIGDLGRSLSQDYSAPHDDLYFAGDRNYKPPEIHYRHILPEWRDRVYAIDIYLIGSMLCYYFTGLSINALIKKNLYDSNIWSQPENTFNEVKPYLLDAFNKSLNEFSSTIDNSVIKEDLKVILKQCCYPYPEMRGHPANIKSRTNSYNLHRYITSFDVLYKKVKYNLTS